MNYFKILLKSLFQKKWIWIDTMMEEKIGPIGNNNENLICKAITTLIPFLLICKNTNLITNHVKSYLLIFCTENMLITTKLGTVLLIFEQSLTTDPNRSVSLKLADIAISTFP